MVGQPPHEPEQNRPQQEPSSGERDSRPAPTPQPDQAGAANEENASATDRGEIPGNDDATTTDAPPDVDEPRQEPLSHPDRLAQVADTTSPPATQGRTLPRWLKIVTPVSLLLGLVFLIAQVVRPLPSPALKIEAGLSPYNVAGHFEIPWPKEGQAAVQMEGVGSLGTFGKPKPVPTASVAKVMAAYVLLKEHPLKEDEPGPMIEVDAKAVQDGQAEHESRIEGLKVGAKFSQQDMMKMLMIPSGNNIARLLARWDTGTDSETAFVRKMNDAAKQLGMKDTTYTDPSGLDAKTVSTAVDQLKLAEAVMKFDAFRAIVALPNATIDGLPEPINNNNDRLLLAGLSIRGIKTGSHTAAGGALMWAAYKTIDDKTPLILGTMMDQHVDGPDPNGANSLILVQDNSKKVIEAVRNALTSAVVVKKGQVVGHHDNGLGGRTPLVATEDLKAIGLPGQRLALRIVDSGKAVPHTAKAGTEVGTLTIGGGPDATKVPVALQKDLTEPSFVSKLTRLG
ncbi:D-alanyl-D-alanine carboxypeptidase family protein [Streptomyces sp. NBC_00503]|uniref:D-alanyl-D-alanine carboxypeptidase family protein n=1 Tax=Streptomyces sp. NBC_00503 TaxID=2903659 RepID=UPI002E817511|nr:D-alanyl-D-alanine carboxypeptidase [Streptomyces sp. NBC_00503]WUD82592.1 D-alanyl-D-alanine carboxypeptidase [Streptomyces sp. NBC_00503]